jgi:hypothetical protein
VPPRPLVTVVVLAAARDPIGPPSALHGRGAGRSDLRAGRTLLRRSSVRYTDRSSESMRAAGLLRLVRVRSARPPGLVTGAGRFPPRLGRPQREVGEVGLARVPGPACPLVR